MIHVYAVILVLNIPSYLLLLSLLSSSSLLLLLLLITNIMDIGLKIGRGSLIATDNEFH